MQRKHNIKFKLYRLSKMIPIFCILLLLSLVVLPDGNVSAADPSAALKVSNENLSTTVAPGEIGYLSSNVTYSTTNTANYALQVSYANGYNGLRLETESGSGDSSNDITIPALASSMTGNAMASSNTDAWGYGWSDNADLSEAGFAGLTYSAMPSYGNVNNIKTGAEITNGSGKIVFAAKFSDANQATGHYKTKVLLSLIATPNILTTYGVTYDLNGGTNGPSNYTESLYDTTKVYTIPTTTPTKAGYEFLGWSTDSTATAADANYAPGKSITLTQDSPSLELHAVWNTNDWDGNTVDDWNNLHYMQQMTKAACESTGTTGSGNYPSRTLVDARDQNTYTVTKLDDQKCWMTQNLQFDLSKANIITVDNTDVAERFITKNTWLTDGLASANSSFEGEQTSDAAVWNNGTGIANADKWQPEYGYYYNWCAAGAGSCKDGMLAPGTIVSSICPKGWRMPAESDYTNLLTAANIGDNESGSVKIRSAPYNFAYSGTVTGSTLGNMGVNGSYWTTTSSHGSARAHILYLTNSRVVASVDERGYGLPIRCIASSD